jgi:hypothetical protein
MIDEKCSADVNCRVWVNEGIRHIYPFLTAIWCAEITEYVTLSCSLFCKRDNA